MKETFKPREKIINISGNKIPIPAPGLQFWLCFHMSCQGWAGE